MSTAPKFDTKTPATGIPYDETRAWFKELGRQRFAVVCLESVERTAKADFDADDTVKLRIVNIEVPTTDDGQDALRIALEDLYRNRTSQGTFDEVTPNPAPAAEPLALPEGSSTKLERANCTVCGRDVAARRNGTAREHFPENDPINKCAGSGEPVVWPAPEAEVEISEPDEDVVDAELVDAS